MLYSTLLLSAAGLGCGTDEPTTVGFCPDIGIPSMVVDVRNQFGDPSAIGAELVATGGGVVLTGSGFGDSLRILTGDPFGVGGTFTVEVTKPWYEGARVEDVQVPEGPCGVEEPFPVEVVIGLLLDAPSVRQVVLPPTGYGFGDGNISVEVPAFVEAATGVSQELLWRTSDSTVVSVSQSGKITSGCLQRLDSAWVSATSVVNATVGDSVLVTVWPMNPTSGRCL